MHATYVDSPTSPSNVFRATDPSQAALRRILGALTEDQLILVETDLDYLARSGVTTQRIERLLTDAADMERLAA